jgi:quercetin dioxygenase-like cupin family protein
MGSQPFVIEEASVAVESGEDRGVTWRTLTSADRMRTQALTSGVCEVEPGCELPLHTHPPLEVYYFLEGTGVVTLGTRHHPVQKGSTVYIPGGTPHRIANTGSSVLKLFYVFPIDSYSQVEYTMLEPVDAGRTA